MKSLHRNKHITFVPVLAMAWAGLVGCGGPARATTPVFSESPAGQPGGAVVSRGPYTYLFLSKRKDPWLQLEEVLAGVERDEDWVLIRLQPSRMPADFEVLRIDLAHDHSASIRTRRQFRPPSGPGVLSPPVYLTKEYGLGAPGVTGELVVEGRRVESVATARDVSGWSVYLHVHYHGSMTVDGVTYPGIGLDIEIGSVLPSIPLP